MNKFHENHDYLLEKAANGDSEAAEIIIKQNIGLVRSIAKRFTGRGQELEDLMQIGSIGMLKAIRGYDKSFGTAFSTYAFPLITGEIRRFLRDDGLIKVSRETKKNASLLLRAREKYMAENGTEPALSELSSICDIEEDDAVYALSACSPALSLHDKVSDESDTDFSQLICANDEISLVTDKIALHEALKTLSEDERVLINLRYFKGMTQSETAKILGITQVKVSRTEKKIINKLASEIL